MSKLSEKKNLDSLTGFRGVAAIVVFLAHFGFYNAAPFLRYLKAFMTWHNEAVDIFFVLSGFTLAYVYSGRTFNMPQLKKYFIARFARIYPLYFAALVAGCFLVFPKISVVYTAHDFWVDFVNQLVLVNCWAPIGNGVFFNSPSWSISVELFCYIFVFPVLLFYLPEGRLRCRFLVVITVLTAASYYIYRDYYQPELLLFGRHEAVPPFSYYVNILRGVFGFSVGYLLHLSYRNNDALFRICSKYADLLFALAFFIMLGEQLELGPNNHMLVLLAPLLCLSCASGRGWVNKLLSSKVFVHLGDLSYSIYLLHFLVLQFAILWFGSRSGTPFMVLIVYVVSLVSYYAYEKPARSLINGRSGSGVASRLSVKPAGG